MKPAKLGTVWAAGAKVQVIRGERFETVAECGYTPRAINEALKGAGLRSGWIVWACGREFWTAGPQIARQT